MRVTSERDKDFGFTLLEVLVSMSILSILTLALAELFSFASESWSRQAGEQDNRADLVESARLVEEDLQAAFVGREARWVHFDPSGIGTQTLRDAFTDLLQHRMMLPFEVNRRIGIGNQTSLPFAEPEVRGMTPFSTLAFAANRPDAGALLPETFAVERYGNTLVSSSAAAKTASDACLVGYYVAYTRNSPLATELDSSMKLYRHFRPSGVSFGMGQAGSTLRYASHVVNKIAIPSRSFANQNLDFLLAYHAPDPDEITKVASLPPWPLWGDWAPSAQPDRSQISAWEDPHSSLHESLPGDLPLALNVVRFEVRPYKRMKVLGDWELMGTERLVASLGLPDDEWPALIVPDLIEVVLGVVPPETAAILTRAEDWMVKWVPDSDEVLEPRTTQAEVIQRSVRTIRFQVSLFSDS
ncbi:MAG: prepilin-type N-terminal cleavage/methylation domain-containing protein [Verrucomicrobiota bacterium]